MLYKLQDVTELTTESHLKFRMNNKWQLVDSSRLKIDIEMFTSNCFKFKILELHTKKP